MSGPAARWFAQSYAEARQHFLAGAAARGLAVQSIAHPLPGRDGEPLALDVARFGPATAERVLLLSSGCHGVEGYCGSGAQAALLADDALHAQAQSQGVALVYLHALNPHGFSWWRRVTQENVDLNRNFQDFSAPLPPNPGYDEVAAWLVPETWPPAPEVQQAIGQWIATHGPKAWQQAVSQGQHRHPQGLFYMGQGPTWSQQALRQVLRAQGRQCRRLGWIDFHTGLGPSGVGERIDMTPPSDPEGIARTRRWWGPQVTSIHDGSSTSAKLTGMIIAGAEQECAQAQITGIALEYGTEPLEVVLHALRADHWLHAHPDRATPEQRAAIPRQIRDAFYVDTDEWKTAIVAQALEVTRQAVTGLAEG